MCKRRKPQAWWNDFESSGDHPIRRHNLPPHTELRYLTSNVTFKIALELICRREIEIKKREVEALRRNIYNN